MNSSTLASILMDNCKTVSVIFNSDSKMYTYKTTEDFKVDDFAIVPPTVEGRPPRIVTVIEVHSVPRLDPNAQFDYKWVIGKVDFTDYNQLLSLENTVGDTLRGLEHKAIRDKTKAMLAEEYGLNKTQLKHLITDINKLK